MIKKVKKPFVSIIVPSLNEEKNIEACLKSLRKQDFGFDFEIILADGDSKDKTRLIAKKYVDAIVVEHKHTIAAGRQMGCAKARGELFVFTDSDSIPDKEWLLRITAPFVDPKVVASYGTASLLKPTLLERVLAKTVFSLYLLVTSVIGMHSGPGFNLAVRASAFHAVKGFDVHLVTAEDVALLKKLKKHGKIVFVPGAVVAVSPRRIRKWGLLKFISFHVKNLLEESLLGKSEREYEPVR
ncbi:MAG: glycosyltransferase [Candidatus Micrarchaeota archaeon]